MRLACFNSLRWAKDFPWGRGSETAENNTVTFHYTSECTIIVYKEMVRIVYTSGRKLAGYLHLAWENALMETGQPFDCQCLDGRREHKASLANMALTLEESCDEHKPAPDHSNSAITSSEISSLRI